MPFVSDLLVHVKNWFVETGTYQGDTPALLLHHCPNIRIRTLELSTVFYNNCKDRFKDASKVEVFHRNSKYDLYETIRDIDEEITFWLDGHWSGVADVGCDPETMCPVLFELDQIKQHPIKSHTIMVDDIRLMNQEHFQVSVDDIVKKIYEINEHYVIKYYDDEYSEKDVLVAYVET